MSFSLPIPTYYRQFMDLKMNGFSNFTRHGVDVVKQSDQNGQNLQPKLKVLPGFSELMHQLTGSSLKHMDLKNIHISFLFQQVKQK